MRQRIVELYGLVVELLELDPRRGYLHGSILANAMFNDKVKVGHRNFFLFENKKAMFLTDNYKRIISSYPNFFWCKIHYLEANVNPYKS